MHCVNKRVDCSLEKLILTASVQEVKGERCARGKESERERESERGKKGERKEEKSVFNVFAFCKSLVTLFCISAIGFIFNQHLAHCHRVNVIACSMSILIVVFISLSLSLFSLFSLSLFLFS